MATQDICTCRCSTVIYPQKKRNYKLDFTNKKSIVSEKNTYIHVIIGLVLHVLCRTKASNVKIN